MLTWLVFKSLLAITLLTPTSWFYQEGLLAISVIHGLSDSIFAIISLIVLKQKTQISLPKVSDLKSAIQQPKGDTYIIIFQQLITPISMIMLTMIAAKIDYTYVASFALLFRLEALFLLLPMVLTTSLPAIIGTNYWSGHKDRVKAAYQLAFALIIIVQLLIACWLYFNSKLLTALICPQQSVAFLIESYLLWLPISYIGAGCAIVYQSCLNAKGKTELATLLGIIHRIVLLIPFTYLGSITTVEHGLFIGIMLGHLGSGLAVAYLFKKEKSNHHYKNKVVLT